MWLYTAHRLRAREIASELCVSQKTVRRYLSMFSQCGEVKAKSQQHRPLKLLGDFEEIMILRMITDFPGIYLHEMQEKLFTRFGMSISVATLCRTLKRMGCTRQVIQHIAIQRSDDLMAEVSVYDPAMLLWIDESGCDRRDGIRKFGYSMRGIPPKKHRLLIRGTRYSAIPIISTQGIHDICLYEGTVNGRRCSDFVKNSLIPIMQPFNGINPLSVVIMDNASIHHVEEVRYLIENQIGGRLLFLPPYSPDLNSLEEAFSQVKRSMILYFRSLVHHEFFYL